MLPPTTRGDLEKKTKVDLLFFGKEDLGQTLALTIDIAAVHLPPLQEARNNLQEE